MPWVCRLRNLTQSAPCGPAPHWENRIFSAIILEKWIPWVDEDMVLRIAEKQPRVVGLSIADTLRPDGTGQPICSTFFSPARSQGRGSNEQVPSKAAGAAMTSATLAKRIHDGVQLPVKGGVGLNAQSH